MSEHKHRTVWAEGIDRLDLLDLTTGDRHGYISVEPLGGGRWTCDVCGTQGEHHTEYVYAWDDFLDHEAQGHR